MSTFPASIISEIVAACEDDEGVVAVIDRPLVIGDPNYTVAVYAGDWEPVDFEIGMVGDSISRYKVEIQFVVKSLVSSEGRDIHAKTSKKLRSLLSRNAALRENLGKLSETDDDGFLERMSRWGVQKQRFNNMQIDSSFYYLSTTELWFETETVQT